MIPKPVLVSCIVIAVANLAAVSTAQPVAFDSNITYRVELTADSPVGEASIREHSVAWHPVRRKYYLIADVVPLSSPHHPNTYGTELHLWSSEDLAEWTYHGVAVRKGVPGETHDGYGGASPAGMAYHNGRLYVPFSGRRLANFSQRGIGLAWSGTDPEKLPWTKTLKPISDLPGEDDDPAVVTVPGDERLHLYHRRTGPPGYRIVHTASSTPTAPDSWPKAVEVTPRPDSVRAQELTGAVWADDTTHMFVIEHPYTGSMQIAHLRSPNANGPFTSPNASTRYVRTQPRALAYGGHITPVVCDGRCVAYFWTAVQAGRRYGLLGHPAVRQ